MSEHTRPAKKTRTYRKNQALYALISKMKLWSSRQGVLHGIKELSLVGDRIQITTFCGHTFTVQNSRTSRASRWLRNKSIIAPCPKCKVPDWKIEKYQGTSFKKTHGAKLS